jgi:hypothetical protein
MNDEIILTGADLIAQLFVDWVEFDERQTPFEQYAPEINTIDPFKLYSCNAELSEIFEVWEGDYLWPTYY